MRPIDAEKLETELCIKYLKAIFSQPDDPIAALENIKNLGIAFKLVEESPTLDSPVTVHAHWKKSDIPGEDDNCSHCGGANWYYGTNGTTTKSRFCPNCGAIMDEEEEK